MNKEDKYSNRMSLPKDGMILAENDDILLRAVSEGQKDYMQAFLSATVDYSR